MTKTDPFRPAEHSEEEASLWAARLRSGPFSGAQRTELRAWLAQDPAHGPMLDEFCRTSADLDGALAVLRAEGSLEASTVEFVSRSPSRRRRARGLAVVSMAGVAVLVLLAWPGSSQRFITAPGERKTFALADGSSLTFNAHTAATVTFERSARRVKLIEGEALFTVAKDPSRPFFVTTPHGVVRVTGTVFNVRADAPQSEEVTVLEGTVQVAAQEAAPMVAMHPGDQALLSDQAPLVQTVSPEALQRVTAWREGRVVFAAEPLRSALERVAWYHGRKIDVSAGLEGLTLGGQYDLEDLDALLQGIEQVHPIKILHGENGEIRVVPRN
jgi:transmembrane sensor